MFYTAAEAAMRWHFQQQQQQQQQQHISDDCGNRLFKFDCNSANFFHPTSTAARKDFDQFGKTISVLNFGIKIITTTFGEKYDMISKMHHIKIMLQNSSSCMSEEIKNKTIGTDLRSIKLYKLKSTLKEVLLLTNLDSNAWLGILAIHIKSFIIIISVLHSYTNVLAHMNAKKVMIKQNNFLKTFF